MTATPLRISVDRIFLDLDNPRHDPCANEAEVIDYLCREEYVYPLAKDMAAMGLNPLELFAVIPLEEKKKRGTSPRFVVAEGNRRFCAIKLLNDPDLAPPDLRKDFRRLAESTKTLSEVLAIPFDDKDQANPWLERLHGNLQGGIGRKSWSPEQKARHVGDRKNVFANTILDYAVQRGFISAEERKGKLTTAQRYLGNKFLREAIGIESSSSTDVSRIRPSEDVDLLLRQFTRDLVEDVVHSRANAVAIKQYSRTLSGLEGLSGLHTASESLTALPAPRKNKRPSKEPLKPKSIRHESEIEKGLKRINSYKLQKLYYSICELALDKHMLLISVGVWSFLESLTAKCGRASTVAFSDYLSKQKLGAMGFSDRDRTKAISLALGRIADHGNTIKHHQTAANFNGEQLANDMETLKDVIVHSIGEITT